MRCALVDLGSNTIRLSVYEAAPDGGFSLLFSEKEAAALASFRDGGVLTPEGVDRACGALERFSALLEKLSPQTPLHVFATAPLRNISNTAQAVEAIRARTGLAVEVLSGEEEAALSCRGAAAATGLTDGAVFDIGGGSSEVAELRGGEICRAVSFPLGSLGLFRRRVEGIWPDDGEVEALRSAVAEALEAAELPPRRPRAVCAVGGTARALGKMADGLLRRGAGAGPLSARDFAQVSEALLRRDKAARTLVLRTCPDRVHTILPGLILMEGLCRALEAETIAVSPYGVREGYLLRRLLP